MILPQDARAGGGAGGRPAPFAGTRCQLPPGLGGCAAGLPQLGLKLGALGALQLPRLAPPRTPSGRGAQVRRGRGSHWHRATRRCGLGSPPPHRDKAAFVQTQLIPALRLQIPSADGLRRLGPGGVGTGSGLGEQGSLWARTLWGPAAPRQGHFSSRGSKG